MDFITLAKERYSCRKFSDAPVEKEKIENIIAAASAAPTAVNKQPFKIWVAESESACKKIGECTRFTFGAKTFFILGYSSNDAWVRAYDGTNFGCVDGSIVATHMMLEIQDLGLGTTWVGSFDAPKMHEMFPETEGYELIAIFPVGYPAEDAKPSDNHFKRKDISDMVSFI